MGMNNLRKMKLSLEADVVDIIPNDRNRAQRIQRQGNSNQIVLPSQWEMHFPDGAEVLKVLVKIRMPALGRIAYTEYHAMLVVETSDFPIEKMCKKVN